MNFNKNKYNEDRIKAKFKAYLNNQKLNGSIKRRIYEMYVKEMEHLIDMEKRFKHLNPFTKIFKNKIITKNDILIKDSDDLYEKSLQNVNKIFHNIFGSKNDK